MIDAGEKLPQVALQHRGVAARQLLHTLQGAVRALAEASGVGVSDEGTLEDRLDEVAQGMVHHAVAERCGGDEAALGFVDEEVRVGAWTIRVGAQGVLERQQVFFQTVFKGGHACLVALAAAGALVGEEEVVPGGQLGVSVQVVKT